jgi:hypothetical protein
MSGAEEAAFIRSLFANAKEAASPTNASSAWPPNRSTAEPAKATLLGLTRSLSVSFKGPNALTQASDMVPRY